jgi:GNAT superfamily N-acetyltransferase
VAETGAPLLEHARAFGAAIAGVLGGTSVDHPRLTGFRSSPFDRFLNQLFASAPIVPREAVEALDGFPGFVWLTEAPAREEVHPRVVTAVMSGMTATTDAAVVVSFDADIAEVRSGADLDAWHWVYAEVFGSGARGRDAWRELHRRLGPGGEDSLVLLLACADGSVAATAAVYLHGGWAGLYCFTTLERMRGRGLASALVHASHEVAWSRGVRRALLHATPVGAPVYARAGYRQVRELPLLVCG